MLKQKHSESQLPGQRSGIATWSGITESRTLDCQRTPNTRVYSHMKTPMKASTYIQDLASPNCRQHPVQDSSLKQWARQKHKPKHQQTWLQQRTQNIPPHAALHIQEEKIHLLLAECKWQSLPTQSLHKRMDQLYTPKAKAKRNK